jgi:predicted 2-oxoglutarate/Fe(II)-dependent dioxygenase YbiX
MNSTEYFEKNRYIYLSEVLPQKVCQDLTQHMHNLHKEGQLVQDEQCPLSWSVYGDPKFDALLANLAKPIGEKLGIEILPTYTYARLYQPGDILKKHTDRPSCEISGTMTLGYDPDSAIWPIFFGKDQDDPGTSYQIDVGDLVMYRGNELVHWRPAYKGKWQVQVFFHYVDANGPHKEWANDKRPELGLDSSKKEEVKPKPKEEPDAYEFKYHFSPNTMAVLPQADHIPGYAAFYSGFKPNLAFTPEECERVIATANQQYAFKARIGSEATSKTDLSIRNVDQYHIGLNEDTRWIYDKLMLATAMSNHEHFKYNISGITHELQLLHYRSDDGNGHYDWHVDVGHGDAACRKISISVMLSPDDKYKGGDLEVNDHGVLRQGIREQGSINLFPSYMPHRVAPVTEGERWALVIWINGPDRFK